jgi:hypothetical protein
MTKWFGCAVIAAVFAFPGAARAGELRLSIANGRVTLVAQDVPLRQILDEWARVGQTKVLGAERLTGPAVTLELLDVPEARALETLLRSASGYIAKPRAGTVGASAYDKIMIMPPSRPPAVTAAGPAPFVNRPQPQVVMPNVVDDDEMSPIMPPGSVPPQPQMFPGQMPMQPGMQPPMQPGMQPPMPPGMQPGPAPAMTSPRPGQLPPPSPGMPGNPYQTNPQQPIVRPPGGPGGGQIDQDKQH